MKKIIALVCMITFCMTSNAQLIKPKNQQNESYTLDANGHLVKNEARPRKSLFGNSEKTKTVDEKYLAGACPEVNGKVQFDKTFETTLSAQQAYERLLTYMNAFVRSNGQTQKSNVSLIDPTNKQIATHLDEWLIFENKPLSLDQTRFIYNLIITCNDNRVDVSIRNLSYVYDEERGGGAFPAEDMISDAQAINKKGDGFQKGGSRKFRTKTIDRKDTVFSMIAEALK